MEIFKYSVLNSTYKKINIQQEADKIGVDVKEIQIHLNDISELIDENQPYFYTNALLAPKTAFDIRRGFFDKYYSSYPIIVIDEYHNIDYFSDFNTVCDFFSITEDELENALIGKNDHELKGKKFGVDILNIGSDI